MSHTVAVAFDQTGVKNRDPRRPRALRAMAAVLAGHLIVLIALGLGAPHPRFVTPEPEPTLTLQLMTPELHVRPHTAAAPPSGAPQTLRLHIPPPTPETKSAPSPLPAPMAATPPGPALAASGEAPDSDFAGRARAMLRATVGCGNPDATGLTQEEKAECTRRFGEGHRAAAFSAIDPLKRGGYDEQALADERKRNLKEGNMPEPIVPCDGPGSNFGTGCLPAEAVHHFKPN